MSLDLTRVASQVGEMLSRLKVDLSEREQHLQFALDTMSSQADNIEDLKRKIAAGRTTWLVADPLDGLEGHYQAPPLPDEFSVLATEVDKNPFKIYYKEMKGLMRPGSDLEWLLNLFYRSSGFSNESYWLLGWKAMRLLLGPYSQIKYKAGLPLNVDNHG